MSYYFTADGKNTQGPAPLQQLATLVREMKLPANLHVCEVGGKEWKAINTLVPAIQLAPHQKLAVDSAQAPAASSQSSSQDVAHRATAQAHQAQVRQEQVRQEQVRQEQSHRAPAESTPAVAERSPAASTTSHGAHQEKPMGHTPAASPAKTVGSTQLQVQSTGQTDLALSQASDFSDLAVASTRPVAAKDHIAKGTRLHTTIGYAVVGLVAVFGFVVLAFMTYGIAILLMAITYWLTIRRGHAHIHGGSVHVNEEQFPEIHQCTQEFAQRLGMKTMPEVYVVEGSVLNAFAAKLGKRKYILLIDDIVHGCLLSGETKALSFIIAHELAHHSLGHTGLFRSSVSTSYKALSRCDELSCDSVAADLVENRDVCARGLGLLLIGPQLLGKLNWRALDRQAEQLMANKTWKGAESKLSHPLLLRRYAALRQG